MEDVKHMWKLLFGGKVTETLDNCAKCITNLDTCIYRTGGASVSLKVKWLLRPH